MLHTPAFRNSLVTASVLALLLVSAPAPAQAQINRLQQLVKGKELYDKVRPMTADEERELGQSVGHRLKSNMGVVDDPAMQRYVNMVGLTVARQVTAREGFPFRFIVVDVDHINAFSVPGGDIYITRGLVESVTTEAQLAGVLAHEITHSIERHAAKAVEKSDRWAAVGDAAMSNRAELFQVLTDAATSAVLTGFGREEERHCDLAGLDAATAAGYQSQGLPEFLAILKLDSEKGGNKNRGGLLGSHPEVGARIAAVTERIESRGLSGGQRLADRYHTAIPEAPADRTLTALLARGGGSGSEGGDATEVADAGNDEPKKKKLGFGRLKKLAGMGGDSQSEADDRSSSAAVRGVGETELGVGTVAYTDPKIDIDASQLAAFIKEGGLT